MTAKKKPITSESEAVTDGQRKQYLRFVEDAAERALKEADLKKDGIQRVLEHGDELQAAILASLKELATPNEFAKEEIESAYGYPAGYSPKPTGEQVAILQRLFPQLGSADESLASKPLPAGAEAHFAIPRWQKLATTYPEAVQLVIAKLDETLGNRFKNWREGALSDKNVRLNERTAARFELLGQQQEGHDILVVPAQFGLRHRGRSVRRARAVFTPSEFGLGSFAVGCMLLTHPERLTALEDLCVDCAGDDYSPDGDGDFDHGLSFDWDDGGLGFYYYGIDTPRKGFGSASGFAAPS